MSQLIEFLLIQPGLLVAPAMIYHTGGDLEQLLDYAAQPQCCTPQHTVWIPAFPVEYGTHQSFL